MNKAAFVELVQQSGEYKTKKEAELAIASFVKAIERALVNRDEVSILGFGTFSAELQKGKSGKVPGTDKTYTTTDKIVPKCKFSATLKGVVASGK